MILHRLLMTAAAALVLAGPALAQPAAAPAAPPADAAAPAAPAAAPTMSVQITPAGDIADTLKASGQFTLLVKALDATNLTSVLKTAGPLTILAPTDAAFQALPAGQLANLMKVENAAQLQALLTYHLINAGVPMSKIQGSKGPIRTVANTDVQVDGTGLPIRVNNASVVGHAAVSNGDIYAIDTVLTPGGAAAAPAAPAEAPAPAPTPAPAH
jgi:uncharacterized surface protein with fasciclin (FAS1) repeats